MATFHFDLVSPEKLLFSGDVDQVDVPGSEGDFGVLADHAPFITTMRPGILTIFQSGAELKVVVYGGFADVNPSGLTALADMAVPVEEFDKAWLTSEIARAEEDAAKSDGFQHDKLALRYEQLKALQTNLTARSVGVS